MSPKVLPGFTASMLGEGTRSRSKAKLDEAIEFVGGSLFASAGMHVTTVFARSLDTDLKLAMLLMADEVLNPLLPPAALEKLKQGAKASLRMARSQPDALADTGAWISAQPIRCVKLTLPPRVRDIHMLSEVYMSRAIPERSSNVAMKMNSGTDTST